MESYAYAWADLRASLWIVHIGRWCSQKHHASQDSIREKAYPQVRRTWWVWSLDQLAGGGEQDWTGPCSQVGGLIPVSVPFESAYLKTSSSWGLKTALQDPGRCLNEWHWLWGGHGVQGGAPMVKPRAPYSSTGHNCDSVPASDHLVRISAMW